MSPAKPKKKTAAEQAAAKPSPAKARAAARAAEIETLRFEIESAWERRAALTPEEIEGATRPAVDRVIEGLEKGDLRVAEPDGNGGWAVNEWLKKAVLLYFRTHDNALIDGGHTRYFDKVPLKYAGRDEASIRASGTRVVPDAVVRKGSYVGPDVVLMPSFVNIGAFVDAGTMVDTWATVGSCAQIGRNVHLSGGVGIGGVLEPVQASPVIIEDNCFIGSRCIVVEGVRVGKEAVLGANVVLTMSTKIIDVTGPEPVEYKGYVPERSVVIPGSYTKQFPAGEFQVPCALIIGKRKASTDLKTSLNDALRENNVAV